MKSTYWGITLTCIVAVLGGLVGPVRGLGLWITTTTAVLVADLIYDGLAARKARRRG